MGICPGLALSSTDERAAVSTERWQRLNELFADAMDAAASERAARIAQACGDDHALRAEALSLLTAAERSGDFLITTALDTLAQEVANDGWTLRPGDRVGAYRVQWLLGSGGAGEVWRAHDERLERDVAIKVLLPHFASNADRLRRFQQEARAAGALNHANILAVYDVGEHKGAPFLVSECLEGESLRKRLNGGSLAVDDTLAIALQVARGLGAAHARGIIHRDLKPDNVFLRSDGGVKILDFGLAKLRLPHPDRVDPPASTMSGVIAGTPGYMAPEQVRGEDVDTRADLFALGAMLYEMLSGGRPFDGASTIETLHAILAVDPAALVKVRPDVPLALSHIVHRCLEKSPTRRFQSADEVITALDAAAATRRMVSTGKSLSVLGESAAGTRLGGYVIVAHLGRGSIGDTYRARDTTLHRDVVLEILGGDATDDGQAVARIQSDMTALSAASHPNIETISGVEAIDGTQVLVRELVEGHLLTERIAKAALPVDEALPIATQIAGALEAAHDHGVLHRELAPSKVIVRSDGSVKVVGFGSQDGDPISDTHAIYRSPEQMRGEPIDKRADLWAFGCLLFEILTGRAVYPISGSADASIGFDQEPDWSAVPRDTPPRVRAVLQRCLQRDPARRLRDAGDARLELEEPVDPVGQLMPAAKRGIGWSTLVAWTITLASVSAAAVALMDNRRSRETPIARPPMRFIPVTNFAGVESQPALSPDGRSVAFVSNRNGQWDIYVSLVSGGNVLRITNDPNVETKPRWSPDGARLAFARLNEQGLTDIWVVPAFGGTARRIVLNATTPAWSHDGKLIAYRSAETIWIADASGANVRAITKREPSVFRHSEPAFSHDGKAIVFVRQLNAQRSELGIADLESNAVRNLTADGALALSPVWSPDDRYIYFASSRGGTMSVWKIGVTSSEFEQVTAGQDDNEEIDLSGDGKRLAFSSSRSKIGLAEMTLDSAPRGALRWLTTDSAQGETAPRYSPDGRRIVYFTNRNGLETDTLWVMDADGRNATRIIEDGRFNLAPRWLPDGRALLFSSRADNRSGGGPVEVRRISLSGGAPEMLPVKPFATGWGDVAADGRLIVRTSARGGEIYDLRTNQRQQLPDVRNEPGWSPGGKLFAFVVPPSGQPSSDAGLWIGTTDGLTRHVFQGWVVWFAFNRAGDLLFLEGKPDLKGILWRADASGSRRTVLGEMPILVRHNEMSTAATRFDVHPDGRHIVLEARPVFEADIGLIDGVR